MTGADDVTEMVLMRRAREGDEGALFALFDRHTPALRARVGRWMTAALLRKVSASDVMQEARLVALRRFDEFQGGGEGAFGRWLGKIVELQARAAAGKYARTAKRDLGREVTRGGRPDTRQFVGKEPSPSQAAMAKELKDDLRKALAELAPDYRQVVRLLQDEDVTFQEAGARMGRSPEAVRMLYGRALARLAKLLNLKDREAR